MIVLEEVIFTQYEAGIFLNKSKGRVNCTYIAVYSAILRAVLVD
jgi:hypothetical protein